MAYADQDLNQETDGKTNRHLPKVERDIRSFNDLETLRARWRQTDAIPVLLAHRLDAEDNSFLDLDIRTLLRGEDSGGRHAAHSVIFAPGASIPPHSVHVGDTTWFLLAGELDITIGAVTRRLRAPAFAYAPALTTQAAVNRSSAPVELQLCHSPAGADRAFAAAHAMWLRHPDVSLEGVWESLAPYGFVLTHGKPLPNDMRTNSKVPRVDLDVSTFDDFVSLRERWSEVPAIPKIVDTPEQCENIVPVPKSETRVLLRPEESASFASAFLCGLEEGVGAPSHHQPSEDEFFIVIEGPLKLKIGNLVEERAAHGAFGFAPRYGTHTFTSVKSEGMAFHFSMNSPGGHDRGFETGMSRFGSDDFMDLMEAHGFTFHEKIGD